MGFLTVLVYVLLSVSMGAFLIGLSLDAFSVPVIIDYVEQLSLSDYSLHSPRWIVFLSGLLLVLLCVRYLQASWNRSRKDTSIRFESQEGNVSITLFAIEDMLKKMLEQRTEVSHVRPKLFKRKHGIEIVVKGVLTSQVNLVEFAQELQEKVKEKMSALLGPDKEIRVTLEIKKVAIGGKKEAIEEEEPKVPFRNY